MTELGGVGIAIALVFVGALFALMRTAKGDLLRLAVAAALLGSLVAYNYMVGFSRLSSCGREL